MTAPLTPELDAGTEVHDQTGKADQADTGPETDEQQPRNPLEWAMLMAVAEGTQRAWDQLCVALSGSVLYAVTPTAPEVEEQHELDEATRLDVVIVTAPDGHPVVPAFSSLAELRSVVPPGYGYVELPAPTLLAGVDDGRTSVSLNDGASWSCELLPELIAALVAGGVTAEQVPAGQLAVGEPSEEPTELLAALVTAFGGMPEVVSARRTLAVLPGETDPTFVVGVVLAPGADVGAAMQAGAAAGAPSGVPCLLLPLGPGDEDPLSRHLLDAVPPFYPL